MGRLYESRVVHNLLNLIFRSVALDILFLEYISKMCSFAHTVNDILANLLLPFVVVGAAEELVPERLYLLAHNTILLPSP